MQDKSKKIKKIKKACQVREDKLSDCAHEASAFLQSINLLPKFKADDWCDYKDGLCLCTCGKPIKAKELRDYYLKRGYKIVKELPKEQGERTYLIYQQKDQQGHVFVRHQGRNYGNGNYQWKCDSQIYICLI